MGGTGHGTAPTLLRLPCRQAVKALQTATREAIALLQAMVEEVRCSAAEEEAAIHALFGSIQVRGTVGQGRGGTNTARERVAGTSKARCRGPAQQGRGPWGGCFSAKPGVGLGDHCDQHPGGSRYAAGPTIGWGGGQGRCPGMAFRRGLGLWAGDADRGITSQFMPPPPTGQAGREEDTAAPGCAEVRGAGSHQAVQR